MLLNFNSKNKEIDYFADIKNPQFIINNEKIEVKYDKDMMKKDLREAAGLSTNVIAKLGKNQDVSTEVLRKICKALNCEITDIMELIDEDDTKA